MTRATIFSFVSGVVLVTGWYQAGPITIMLPLVAGSLVILARSKSIWVGWAALCLGVFLGWLVGARWQHDLQLLGTTVVQIEGTVIAHDASGEVLGSVWINNHRHANILITTQNLNSLGAHLDGRCQVAPVPAAEQWRRFAQKIIVTCQPVGKLRTNSLTLYGRLLQMRAGLVTRIEQQFNPAESALLTGVLVGDTTGMDRELRTAFRRTGTTHIVALSGFNVTIIISSLLVVLQPRFGRTIAVLGGLGFVLIFVVMTGMSSSVMRAAVMAFVVQGGRLLGRPVHPDRLLLLTVGVMMLANPFLFWHDLGFQLSCTSTFALMRLSSGIQRWTHWLPSAWSVQENAASTAAATFASQPIILSFTGQLPLLSLPTNILVLPLIPLIMAIGTVVLPIYFLPTQIAAILLAPLDLLLHSVLTVLQWFAAIPWSAIAVTSWGRYLITALCTLCVGYLYRYDETHPD